MQESTELILEGFIPRDRMEGYLHVPFDVPAGTARLDVSYSHDFKIGAEPEFTDGNTIDIGIFDQRGPTPEGFRGWSGSDRTSFFLGTNAATPGYMRGPIEAGRWNIVFGLYKLAPTGCNYRITITFTSAEPNAKLPTFPTLLRTDRANLTPRSEGWYKGELHCHTVHSDGDSQPEQVIAAAQALGLDFLAITDHNTQTHWAAENALHPDNLILIPGYEVTTYKGHWNIWGGEGFVDFRIETPEQMHKAIDAAKQHGYLASCNHPRAYGCTWQFTDVLDHDCFEVWNGPWMVFNEEALAQWDSLLRAGRRFPAVGGSDCHRLAGEHGIALATPTTWIYCPGQPSARGLLDGLRVGHAFISDAPDGPQLYLSSGNAIMGDTISRPAEGALPIQVRVVNGKGLSLEIYSGSGCVSQTAIDTDEQSVDLRLAVADTPYVRAQIVAGDYVRALTNPIYVR